MTTAVRTIRVWDDTVQPMYSLCRACQARIWWARTVANNKPVCFDSVPITVKEERVTVEAEWPRSNKRTIRFVAADRVHWGKCFSQRERNKAT